ncbi:hypothetical protein TSA1_09725 [Bradyrhizobium nitroreducens]|uniref:Helix-hairpin-helix domain-containing protein n=2 Tax=Bradyrhizobium nitroreducens TaxID=709803 RepID=A0A2M6U8T7_9BRAD|nr:hypothetical protein TSA1_09725 [Bradyrhizobium nitroreducens]
MPLKFACLALAIVGALSVAAFAQSSTRSQNAIDGSGMPPTEFGQLKKVDLNIATAAELRKLPRLSPGSVTAIIESRKKSNFKDWTDFVNRRLVPHFAQDEIRSLVTI